MVATDMGDVRDVRVDRVERVSVRSNYDETKLSFLTTEMWIFVAAVIGVLVATQQNDIMDAWDGWRLVTALAIGYMVSRGLAKAGSSHRDDD